jgi:hypothetical protein
MTVISEPVANIAGLDAGTDVVFFLEEPRVQTSGYGIITTTQVPVRPVAGVLTTPNLKPGVAKVKIGMHVYRITIPDSAEAVALWPLIEAGMPVPPVADQGGFVRNAGGISRVQRITESAYAALPTPDPETLYITFPG